MLSQRERNARKRQQRLGMYSSTIISLRLSKARQNSLGILTKNNEHVNILKESVIGWLTVYSAQLVDLQFVFHCILTELLTNKTPSDSSINVY